ncbi:MAG: N-acetylmuramoyl-L-alanine amidase [Lactobacillaceae bacterium]|jgi:hypothetical protein|nr:N-acetylmuramoyl-L-alanine amidase [Lactobacillaceae bacterium]
MNIENQIVNRPAIGVPPFKYVVSHSTGNLNATAQNEADYVNRAWEQTEAYYTHVVGNGRVIQVNPVGQGSWNIGTYDTNVNTYAAVELIESATIEDYKLYVQLLHDLAVEAGLPLTLNNGRNNGIITHAYASRNGFGSDHTDPEAVLARLGISQEQFAKDLQAGSGSNGGASQPAEPAKPAAGNDVDYMRQYGVVVMNHKHWHIDEVGTYAGITQVISHELAGQAPYSFEYNGVPYPTQDELNQGWFTFGLDSMNIKGYDVASNGIQIDVMGRNDPDFYVWVDATAARNA